MDVMEPKVVWVGNRRYRVSDSDACSAKDHASTPYVEDANSEDFRELNDDSCPVDIEIVPLEKGRYKHSFYVPKLFFKFIIGAGGNVRKKLESETRTSITIPRMGQNGDIVITGHSESSIISVRNRIDLLIENSRKKLRPTHFLAIPMNEKNIMENYGEFEKIVVNETAKGSRGVHEGILQNAQKMHLTIVVMVLADEEEIEKAVDALKQCKEEIIMPIVKKNGPITITAQGLDIFHDDPSNVQVVYGKVSSNNDVLQELAEKISDFYATRGLAKKRDEKINLHLTVMNGSFVKRKDNPPARPEKFDATNILKVHKDFYFGESIVNSIQLCEMGSKSEDGYYKRISEIQLN